VIYERVGVELDRSTMADWVGSMAALIDPLYEAKELLVRRIGQRRSSSREDVYDH
jgi:transposase